jgi:hypothetical protein
VHSVNRSHSRAPRFQEFGCSDPPAHCIQRKPRVEGKGEGAKASGLTASRKATPCTKHRPSSELASTASRPKLECDARPHCHRCWHRVDGRAAQACPGAQRKIANHKKTARRRSLKYRLSRSWLMDWPHRRAANSRVPPLHLPQGACTRLCVLAQAKRSTANARALGGFRGVEPLMQRTGRLPVQVECLMQSNSWRFRAPFP